MRAHHACLLILYVQLFDESCGSAHISGERASPWAAAFSDRLCGESPIDARASDQRLVERVPERQNASTGPSADASATRIASTCSIENPQLLGMAAYSMPAARAAASISLPPGCTGAPTSGRLLLTMVMREGLASATSAEASG